MPQIKKELDIAGVQSASYMWQSRQSPSAQIDLVIDRRDHVIALCEIKYSSGQCIITKSYTET
jgi:hypothetical protein